MLKTATGCCARLSLTRLSAASSLSSQASSTSASSADQTQSAVADNNLRAVKVTSAIRAYLKSAEKYDNFIKMEKENFELGKRFLAGMMGVPVGDLTQDNIERAVRYLFPSGLTHYKAKPHISMPEDVFPKKKSLQCDYSGRPNHSMFYTKQPNFYQLLSDIAWKVEQLKRQEDTRLRSGIAVPPKSKLDLSSSHWLEQKQLEKRLLETLSDAQYKQVVTALDFLANMPLSIDEEEFILSYRKVVASAANETPLPELQFDEAKQRHYSEAYGQRKWATATCRLYSNGSGKFTVNGDRLLDAFPLLADREALASPLVVTGMIGKVDIEATVLISSPEQPEGRKLPRTRVDDVLHMASQSGALRLAIARAISCHLPNRQLRDRLRMSGLLTPDMRLPERGYYGQDGPRAKWTWKAR